MPSCNYLYSIGVEEMIKRITFLFCSVLMVVMMLAVPAFATEVQDNSSIKIIKQPEDKIVSINSNGVFNVLFHISVIGDVKSYQWQYSTDDGLTWTNSTFPSALTDTCVFIGKKELFEQTYFRCIVTGSDGSVIISRSVFIEYEPARFSRFITRALEFAMEWIHLSVDSLISPEGALYPLLPILAINIAVTFVLLVTKIFKSCSWGL